MSDHGQRLFIARTELRRAHLGADPDAPAQRLLAPGQVRLAVEAFSLTANNITYAAFGEAMNTGSSFPRVTPRSLPAVWASRPCPNRWPRCGASRRVWGYYPPVRIWWWRLRRCRPRASWTARNTGGNWPPSTASTSSAMPTRLAPELEGLQAVLRPLFMTAFLLDDFLADSDFFGASQVLLSSASSKTRWALRIAGEAPRHAGRARIVG